jgi:hypothetical protein
VGTRTHPHIGPQCSTDTTPANQQIEACNKIIALKVFSGEKLATIYFWRAVGWNKKGSYAQLINGEGANSPFSAARFVLYRHVGAGGAANADTRARRSRRGNQVQTGTVVVFFAAG